MAVLILKDGKREIVTKDRNFIELVMEYMGEDASQYIEDRLSEILDAVNEAKLIAREGDLRLDSQDAIWHVLNGVNDE